MTKSEVLEKIVSARKILQSDLQKVLLLAKGVPLAGDPVPVGCKECAFDKLLRERETEFKNIIGHSFFAEIEALHKQWHEDYSKIYELYYHHGKGFFSKLIGGKPKWTELEREHAQAYSADLKVSTWKIVHMLDMLESRIKKMHEGELAVSHEKDAEKAG
jgi:hypothetical protein